MAHLSFRNSDNTKTEAQLEGKNKILGRVLFYTEVDANFKALNDELIDTKQKFGLGASLDDGSVISTVETTDDLDNLKFNGFYTAETSTTNVPSENNGTPLLNVQSSVNFGADKVTAYQIGAFDNHLMYRNRLGKTTWNEWEKIANHSDLKQNTEDINLILDSVVGLDGGLVKDKVDFQNDSVVTGTQNQVDNTSLGITFLGADVNKVIQNEDGSVEEIVVKPTMGAIAHNYVNNDEESYSNISITVNNPINETNTTGIETGWKLVDGIYVPYAYAPKPYDNNDLNSIATVGWIYDLIDAQDYVSKSLGGTFMADVYFNTDAYVLGNFSIENDLEVNAIYTGEMIFTPKSFVVNENMVLGEQPTNNLVSAYEFANASIDSDNATEEEFVNGGVYHTIDTKSNSIVELRTRQWTDGIRNEAKLGVKIDKDGNASTFAPTPSVTDNSEKVATTEWVNSRLASLDLGTFD